MPRYQPDPSIDSSTAVVARAGAALPLPTAPTLFDLADTLPMLTLSTDFPGIPFDKTYC